MEKSRYRIGIDIGGTGTKFGLVTLDGSIVEQSSLPTTKYPSPENFADTLGDELRAMIRRHGDPADCVSIGIGAPNGNFYTGNIEHAPNLPWKGIVPMAKLLGDRLSLPAVLTNDANAAAMGEMIYGSAKGMKDFFVVTLGTGLGSGFVVDGKVAYGKTGAAGELGHVMVKKNGRPCACGRLGCLQMYISATGLMFSAEEKIGKTMTVQELAVAAREGSSQASEIFDEAGEILGEALANAALLFGPEAIFLSGGVTRAGNLILEPARRSFEKGLMKTFQNTIKILPSGHPENDTAMLGAAALISE
jgi:glucokinase